MTTVAAGSKVSPPNLPPQYIKRPRLTNDLSRSARLPLILVSAGPGSGKTSLLSDWSESRSTPTAWISLEDYDDHRDRFWPLAAQALFAAGIVANAEPVASLAHESPDSGRFFAAFADAIGAPAERTLIVDDVHFLTDSTVLAELDTIIRYGSQHLRVVLSARADPLLPLHRYRLAGLMHEVRAEDMAMTKTEARALLIRHGINLSGPDLRALTLRTEGWAAGLQLSAMSMAGAAHPERFVTQLALDQGSVGEYLMEEVLARQPAPVRQLLIQTSFLDEVSGPLAAAVTGIDGSTELLYELSRTNSFVLPLDRDAGWYRCHQLFAEMLRYLLRREYPNELRALRSRAASWHEKQGDTASAMRYAVQAEDYAHASSLLVHGGLANAYIERQDLLGFGLDGITAIGDEQAIAADQLPQVKVAQAAVAVMHGDLRDAARYLQDVGVADCDPDTQTAAALVTVLAAEQVGAVTELDEAATALIEQSEAVTGTPDAPGLRAAVRVGQASARFWEGRPAAEVEDVLLQALSEARAHEAIAVELECLDLLQLLSAAGGRVAHAKEYDAQTHQLIRTWPQLRLMSCHHLAHAYSAFLRAEFGNAARALRRAEQSEVADSDHASQAALALMRVCVEVNTGRIAEAHQRLRTAECLVGPLPGQLARGRLVIMAILETELGRPNAAVKLLRASPYSAKEPAIAIALSRALLRQGNTAEAASALRPVLLASETTPPLPLLIDALLMSAQIAETDGNDARAVDEVLRATGLAADGIVQPFAAAHQPLAGLLARHPQVRAAWPADPRLTVNEPSDSAAQIVRRLAEPLTDREISVLRRLATTMTTAEIADELCISINTVKTHVAGIYRKLPAAGRRDAVWRARQLELL
jgi:LuxR family transcriptional regulator, maltose regulon positive regulatory protein